MKLMVLESIKMPKNPLRYICSMYCLHNTATKDRQYCCTKTFYKGTMSLAMWWTSNPFTTVRDEANGFGINQNAQKPIKIHLLNVWLTQYSHKRQTVLLHKNFLQRHHVIGNVVDIKIHLQQ